MASVTLVRDGNVAILTLDRAQAANAIDHALAADLARMAEGLAAEGWARAVLLRADGRMFSAGGDLSSLMRSRAEHDPAEALEFFRSLVSGLHSAITALRSIDAPLLAAVNGVAAGGGMSLALACDMILASPRARFVPAYPGIGLSTDGGMSWTLPRAVGERRALKMLLENSAMDAAQALSCGLVADVLPEEDFDSLALQRAHRIAAMPRKAMVQIRRLIEAGRTSSLDQHLERECDAIAALYACADSREGMDAFAQRRPPEFTD